MLGLDQEAHRISLGLKQVEANPWEQLAEKYPIGSKITGKVRNLTEFGAFVEVEEGIDGLIHISDLSWTKRVKHPSEVLKKGDTVEAVVLNIDAENQRLSLGLKQLATDVWDDYFSHHKAGDVVEGKIVRLTTFGAFVELAEGVEGLVHVSELDEKRVERPEEHFKPGDVFPMKIIKVQEGEKKIGLSIRAVKPDEFQKDFQAYRESTGSDRSTLGDVFRAAQAAAAAKEKQEDGGGVAAMTKAELVDEVGREAALTRKHSEVIVDAVFSSIVEALQRGDKIELRGFGSFRVRRRGSRTGRNPKTGAGGRGPGQEGAVLQAGQGAAGADQPGLRPEHVRLSLPQGPRRGALRGGRARRGRGAVRLAAARPARPRARRGPRRLPRPRPLAPAHRCSSASSRGSSRRSARSRCARRRPRAATTPSTRRRSLRVVRSVRQADRRQGLLNLFWLAHSRDARRAPARRWRQRSPSLRRGKQSLFPLLQSFYRRVDQDCRWPPARARPLAGGENPSLVASIIDDGFAFTEVVRRRARPRRTSSSANKRYRIPPEAFFEIQQVLVREAERRLREGDRGLLARVRAPPARCCRASTTSSRRACCGSC